ncbi:MAG: c-type cytochrome, partial [Gammaproteobacteria bacterium]
GERMVAFGGKDGYLYGVNRETRKRVFKTPVTTITAPKPIPNSKAFDMCPGVLGGVEWNGPAYDQKNHAVIIGSVDWCHTVTPDDKFQFKPGTFNMGGSFTFHDKNRGWIVAVDGDTGAERWKYEAPAPQVSGLTPTAGGVIFSGDMAGNFVVLDSSNGQALYQAKTGGALAGGVISYMRDHKQYVAFTSGNVSRISFGEVGSPTLIIYALGGTNTNTVAASSAPGAANAARGPDKNAGATIYGKVCASCHGGLAEGGVGPALKGLAQRMDFERTVQWIENPSSKMPKLFPVPLNAQAVRDVAAYVQTLRN